MASWKPKERVLPGQEGPTQRLRNLLAARLQRIAERRVARRVCAQTGRALAAVRAAQPGLSGDALYVAVLQQCGYPDESLARAALRRTRSDLAEWGSDREPRFIDVVRYLIVNEFLKQEHAMPGMCLDLGPFLARRIDRRL